MVPLLEFACPFLICAAIVYLLVRFIAWVGEMNRAADLQVGEGSDPELDDLHITSRQISRLVETGDLDPEAAAPVLDAVIQRRLQLLHPRPAPPRRRTVVTQDEPEL